VFAFSRLHFGEVNKEEPDGVGLELLVIALLDIDTR
jgi:hypothetical protein